MFIGLGAFVLLCGFEFRYFEMQMGGSPTTPGFVIGSASVSTVAGLLSRVRRARGKCILTVSESEGGFTDS